MKFGILIFIFLLSVTSSVRAAPIKLNCEKDLVSTNNQFQLIIDIENRDITLGDSKLRIIQINENYIYAIESTINEGNGGEAIAIDRKSGRFRWASIDSGSQIDHFNTFSADTEFGQCQRPVI